MKTHDEILAWRTLHLPVTSKYCDACEVGCCCDYCAVEEGFFAVIGGGHRVVPTGLEKLKAEYKWDEDKGFLTDKGCSLPPEKRSRTCLGYVCPEILMHHPRLRKEMDEIYYTWKEEHEKLDGV